MTRLWPALAAALLVVGTAAAEPIRWTYALTFSGNQGSQYVSDGSGGRPDASEPTGFRQYQGYTRLTAAPGGDRAGSGLVTVGAVGHGDFYWNGTGDPPPAFPIDPTFAATLTITDAASGQSGRASIFGQATSRDSWLGAPADANLPEVGQLWGEPSWVRELTLGGHRYQVVFGERKTNPRDDGPFVGQMWDALDVVADVRVAPAGVPEPATLALASVGLGGLMIARRRTR